MRACMLRLKRPDHNDRSSDCWRILAAGIQCCCQAQAAASCDGVYNLHSARITESVRSNIAMQSCVPYPAWPSQDTNLNGTGLASALGRTCPGATAPAAAECTDTCGEAAACAEDTAVTCVPKACVGKVMVSSLLLSPEPCQPVYISKVTGLPVSSCDITSQRLAWPGQAGATG